MEDSEETSRRKKKKTLKNAVMKIRQESTEDTARMLELGMALGSLKM